jgi:hypothetical protein
MLDGSYWFESYVDKEEVESLIEIKNTDEWWNNMNILLLRQLKQYMFFPVI